MPGFFFSSYKRVSFALQGLISFEQAALITKLRSESSTAYLKEYNQYISNKDVKTYSYLYPKERLLIRVPESLSRDDRDILVNQIGGVLTDDLMIVVDLKSLEDTVASTLVLLEVFMIVVGAVAFIITFFLLLVSTSASIRENEWEFGVLRAIGLRKDQITRVYLYESLCVTVSSCILGLLIGFLLALTLSLQFNLFIELPFQVAFPYALTFTMIGLAIAITVVGTVVPMKAINEKQIAGILK
mmetsp:Transcript_2095/g.2663  ORF Transcript_2095/g.2663 Transcript_2095/m.2663 type:complete len:243 (-) Transcript_2095:57-785(-)